MKRSIILFSQRQRKSQSLTVNNDSSSSTSFGKVLELSLNSHDPLNRKIRASPPTEYFEDVAKYEGRVWIEYDCCICICSIRLSRSTLEAQTLSLK